ncbi:5-methylcytosine-specific restriction enzyme A [Pantoea ananatis]|uniref:HNH endonuclease n=1 Tax=Pantoea ananas TaxID=553 RepID=UPI00099DCA0D|nr:HNH endonuclease [Pantoea ananatis]SKA70773.1 5-methylcytosine-specific restriction enzyme A [Pantoea ananatis]
MNEFPDDLPYEFIIKAIKAYDEGFLHRFKEARLYELEFEGRRYPSKAIAGIAASLMTGKSFTPQDFSGGINSKCVRLLIKQGFKIIQDKNHALPVQDFLFPDEVPNESQYVEGAVMQVMVNRYERDPKARSAAVAYHGHQCKVCQIDLSKIYGDIAKEFIHVHHLKQLSKIKKEHSPDPIKDLIPVCPNCHAMLHRKNPPFTPEEIKDMIFKN